MLIIPALFLFSGAAAPVSSDNVYGRWETHDGESIVVIKDCGDGTPCGYIETMHRDPEAKLLDKANKNPDLRQRHLVGSRMLEGFAPGTAGWENGSIYNPKKGRTYRAALRRKDAQSLVVTGCIRIGCRSFVWKAVPAEQ
ncbi:MAG: DUF2147 domain-containing protein [Parvularcula sp.]